MDKREKILTEMLRRIALGAAQSHCSSRPCLAGYRNDVCPEVIRASSDPHDWETEKAINYELYVATSNVSLCTWSGSHTKDEMSGLIKGLLTRE